MATRAGEFIVEQRIIARCCPVDLNAATYQNAIRQTYRINAYVNEVALFEGAELGDVEVRSADISSRVLRLAVPRQGMTAAQEATIEAARVRAEAFGVKLIVTQF